ncbi:hypothetical protein J4429_04430 [Candidatus Pacearchaeota archaeon]|nr:hypothetical protein [Candidatus Pacearchaeota archaeon]
MYNLIFEKSALESLNKLEPQIKEQIWNKLQQCKENPFRFLEHLEEIDDMRGMPYFKGKIGKTAWNGKMEGSLPWKKMNQEFNEHPRRFKKHYRFGVKVECTIHSKKSIHGDKVYSKLISARANEETLRWINHNINVLNRARCEWNINP